ncbi:SEC14 cytosolic factor family protein / phosphoglyceride transfer family protein [Wolffia australiana]
MTESPSVPPLEPPKKSLVSSLMEAAAASVLQSSSSFREDTYFVKRLKLSEKKALQEFKDLLTNDESSSSPMSLWGVPLLGGDEKADVILLKFLRARDFHVSQAHSMLLKSIQWRKEFGVEGIADEDLGFADLEGVVAFMHGIDRLGHPVCYNAYGVFKDREVFDRVFGDDEKLKRFLRWRVQVMERGVGMLQFKPGGVNSIIQVTDLKDMPKRELRMASSQILALFQDNYPEMVARKVFVNVPWYFSMLYSMFSPFLTQRTKSKFVIAKEANVAEVLYKFIRPEYVPVQYGGLSRPGDLEKGQPRAASEFSVKGGERVNLEIDGIELGATITWDIVVGGWEVEYGAEYVPAAENSYTVVIEKTRRMAAGDAPIHNSYVSREAGKMVISVDNTVSRRKKVAAYRYFVRKLST